MKSSPLVVVIPAYNEAGTISQVVGGAKCMGDVIVVDDGSHDRTGQLASMAGASVMRLTGRNGYEGAISAGVQSAIDQGYEFALTMDADGQHRIESAKDLVVALGSADIAIGLRQRKQRLAEILSGWIGSALWQVADPYCGLKLYRLATCRRFAPFDSRQLVGAEMFVRAHRAGLRIVTVPISAADRADAPRFDTRFWSNVRILRSTFLLIALRFGILR